MGNRAIEVLKENGIKTTHNRILILSFLLKNVGHYSTKDIYNNVKKKYMNLNLASVYNTLTIFAEKGIIKLVTKINNMAIWDSNTSAHAHFVCRVCQKIYDLQDISYLDIDIKVGKVQSIKVTYFGICNNCLKRGKASGSN
ncbi:transcriptional repressor [bacterium]|nr:transcriptional repressor [bacterium]